MKFGVREICDVCLRAKAAQKIGNKVFYKNEPVIYFDSLKTSSLEGQATTVYAQGGRGNARLMAWEGERTVTFTMEDALISPVSFSILSGAGLIEANSEKSIIVHKTEQTSKVTVHRTNNEIDYVEIVLTERPYLEGRIDYSSTGHTISNAYNDKEDFIYVMLLDDQGDVVSEPYIASETETDITGSDSIGYTIKIYASEGPTYDETNNTLEGGASDNGYGSSSSKKRKNDLSKFKNNSIVLVDYYVEHQAGAYEIDITPDKFGGNFYLEASTLFRAENGQDMPAEFIIPNCKVQSNFTFSMASSGDPSTFTFTMDAFPDYTRWNKEKKVFAAIQVIDTGDTNAGLERLGTGHDYGKATVANGSNSDPYATYLSDQKPFIEID